MAVYILPVAILCLSIATVVWTWLSVLKNGFSLQVRDPVTGIWHTKVSRVLMWWMFACAITFLLGVTVYDMFIPMTGLVLLVGGIAAGYYIARTAKFEDDMLMSSRAMRAYSVVGFAIGALFMAIPFMVLLIPAPAGEPQIAKAVSAAFFGMLLVYQSRRLWRKASEKAADARNRPDRKPRPRVRPSSDDRGDQWWISWVLGRKPTHRSGKESESPPMTGKKPHLVKVEKRP